MTTTKTHTQRCTSRRASVMVLVMAILSILFVTGVTFLATVNFDAKMIQQEERSRTSNTNVELAARMIDDDLVSGLIAGPGSVGATDQLGRVVPLLDAAGNDILDSAGNPVVSWKAEDGAASAEVPTVRGLLSPIEPLYDSNTTSYRYLNATDLQTMSDGRFDADVVKRGIIDTNGNDPFLPVATGRGELAMVDADGDGIADSRQFLLNTGDLPPAQLRSLQALVNDPAKPGGNAYLAIRCIPHGGMVNLNDSHPTLIDAIMDFDSGTYTLFDTNASPDRRGPYAPGVEEYSLRRRGLIPQRNIPVSAIQGNAADPTDPPPGGGDFGEKLFPPSGGIFTQRENVRADEHRFWMYDNVNDWASRIDPDAGVEYDRRHLSTTISHDDQLMRGAVARFINTTTNELESTADVLDLMVEDAKQDAQLWIANPGAPQLPRRFELLDYPHSLFSGFDSFSGSPYSWFECETAFDCTRDLRKGRLRLSLPWLDKAVTDGTILPQQRVRLIQDVFTVMLMNARGAQWGAFVWVDTDGDGDTDRQVWDHDFDAISIGAASLTANLIDFMDDNDVPTAVAVRHADFTNPDPVLRDKVGLEIDDLPVGNPDGKPDRYVHGLEKQPFITEIVAKTVKGAVGDPLEGLIDPGQSGWAVELFNPYDTAINLGDFSLQIPGQGVDIQLFGDINPNQFFVIINDATGDINNTGNAQEDAPPELRFKSGDTIFLTRQNTKTNRPAIVVDQFEVTGEVARPVDAPGEIWSLARVGVGFDSILGLEKPWFAPIPADPNDESPGMDGHTLGADNDLTLLDDDLRTVEVLFANTGTFETAYPTTGSMLLVMRYANREMDDASVEQITRGISTFNANAFTAHLRQDVDTGSVKVQTANQIDNGRMPVFDTLVQDHRAPAFDPLDGKPWPDYRPGELSQMPWGQFIYDYFTALPLSSPGPYRDTTSQTVDVGAKPRVDQNGLRVHGRINLNAAPWSVLAGLPYVRMNDIPMPFRNVFRGVINPVDRYGNDMPDGETGVLGVERAKAIVAYRDLWEFRDGVNTTGDYATVHGWKNNGSSNTFRRGTGFMTVGELANVRHTDFAVGPEFRMDAGELKTTGGNRPNYLEAIAILASLGDWMTVRSDVFTIYGTIRGDGNTTDEVDDRAIRFQETVDRLPTFMGRPKPDRIGNRVIVNYRDVMND